MANLDTIFKSRDITLHTLCRTIAASWTMGTSPEEANPALAKGECLIRQSMECRKYGAVKRWENVQADGL